MSIADIHVLVRATVKDIRSVNSLRFRALRASAWTMAGYATSQVLRLGGNLLLTRLLFPEAFGLMALVQSVMSGLSMFSDLGVEASIIQNKRGHEETFINTAWTVQVIQGFGIWVLVSGLAIPIARFYHEPLLARLLPVAGFGAVLGGLASTNLSLVARTLALRQRVVIEVGSYFIGLVVMIIWAWIDHSIWSLVFGSLISALAKTVSSHMMSGGIRNRIAFESDCFKELFRFGQWVLVSSMITFIAGEGNKLLVGAFLGVRELAFFTLASTLSLLFWQVIQQLNAKVLFPAYSEVARERPERLKAVARRTRLILIVPGWLLALFFVLWGNHLMWILYDRRYAESGYMLQMFGLGALVGTLTGSYIGLLWSKGLVRTNTILLGVQVLIQIGGMVIGDHFLGERGVVLSAAAVGWLLYPVTAYVHARVDLWQPEIDLPIIAVSAVILFLSFGTIYHRV